MTRRDTTRLAWSSSTPTCATCRRPVPSCSCPAPADEPIPTRVVAKLRLESAGRGGKEVTVVFGLPRNREFLRALATELKKSCGSGGTATDDGVEIQGDRRPKIRELLVAKGWLVKG